MRNSKIYVDLLTDCEKIRKKLNMKCSEIENYLQYQWEDLNQKSKFGLFCIGGETYVSPQFKRGFNTLTQQEKAQYYLSCLKTIEELMKSESESLKQDQVNRNPNERITVYLKDEKHFKEWVQCHIQIDLEHLILKIPSVKQELQLQNYILRFSKNKEKLALALESIDKFSTPITLRISHATDLTFDQLSSKMNHFSQRAIKQKFRKLLKRNLVKNEKKIVLNNRVDEKIDSRTLQFVNSEKRQSLRNYFDSSKSCVDISMEQYSKISSSIIPEEKILKLDDYDGFLFIKKGLFYHEEKSIVKKIFTFDGNKFNIFWLSNQLFDLSTFKIWKSALYNVSFLAEFPSEKTKVFHQISKYKDSTQCDYVYLRHSFNRQNIFYFVDRSIATVQYGSHETSESRGKIDYCLWRFQNKKQGEIQVVVEAQMTHINSGNIYQSINQQIGSFNLVVNCLYVQPPQRYSGRNSRKILSSFVELEEMEEKQSNTNQKYIQFVDKDDSNQFFSIIDSEESQRELDEIQNQFNLKKIVSFKKQSLKIEGQSEPFIEEQFIRSQSNLNILLRKRIKYQIDPLEKALMVNESQLMQFKSNKFFDDAQWRANDKGQLVNMNHEKINAQSSVLKLVVKRMSQNLFTGKSILNVSLPIEIFGEDTNLERLSKSLTYAPIFLEAAAKVSEPIERMKYVICFGIGTGNLYMEMSKPFNPILGETYQGFIDGCPLYAEQISHHPPITALLFKGRGYFVHSCLEAQVNLGLNTASGINAGTYTVAFHSTDPTQNIFQFNGPPGEMSGIIYGERKLILTKKSQYIDLNTKTFCEITWGKSKSKNEFSRFADYFEGKVVRLKEGTKIEDLSKIKESCYQETYGLINGRWNDKVFYNGQEIFDINSIRPYKVKEQADPLPSNCLFRTDLTLRKELKWVQAQNAKEELEEIQRRDRRLRKEHT